MDSAPQKSSTSFFHVWLITSAAIGVLVAVAMLWGAWEGSIDFDSRTILLWPSSIFLMATDGHEASLGAILIMILAVAGNAILYALIGSAIWFVKHLVSKALGN